MEIKKEPTSEQIEDFYYSMLITLYQEIVDIGNHNDEAFDTDFEVGTRHIKECGVGWLRETSPETYEYYVSDGDLNLIRSKCGLCIKSVYLCHLGKHKIKITICDDE